ncbi:MAG: hypothetical protein M0R46_01370 [Candidatus Muirbacterium halophilum]|nr:hypothetical protein [Candidatus Muirbacterium halophilum]MCK9474544.1 hypothetical protein [Candidatus Muirbacterium halophilum]
MNNFSIDSITTQNFNELSETSLQKRATYMKNQERLNILSRKVRTLKTISNNKNNNSDGIIDQEIKRQQNAMEKLVKDFRIEASKNSSSINILA